MAETSNEKSFIDNTVDKVTDFINPNKVKDNASFKDTFNKAIENGVITKDELDALMTRFESKKKDLGKNTQEQLNNLRKEAVTNMLKNGYDIRNSKDIDNLTTFIEGTDFKLDKTLETKLSTIKAFYDKADKSMLENARDFVGYDNLTLTLNEKSEIVEMGILDLNNPLNDNEGEIDKTKYNLGGAEKVDKETAEKEAKTQELLSKVNSSIDDFEKKQSEELEALRKSLQSDMEELKKLGADTKSIEERLNNLDIKKTPEEGVMKTKTDKKETSEKHKLSFDKAKEYNSRYTNDEIERIQMVLGLKQDGKFGTKTFAAVEDFQRKKKLKVDGMVGPKTQTEMGIALGK